ncbi:PQQ-dependent sugar dehydrogenase [Sphingomonas koreensis]|nr:PQQ-dependent sugar dehydrogenase [Sphingomonas koreensis]
MEKSLLLAPLLLSLIACGGSGDASAGTPAPSPTPTAGAPSPTPSPSATPVAGLPAGLPFNASLEGHFDNPFAIAFLPDGELLVTEKPGHLKLRAADGTVSDVAGVPAVKYDNQGGLLDVALAPDFTSSHTIYLSYSEPGSGGSSLALARATLDTSGSAPKLDGFKVLWHEMPKGDGGQFGAVITFSPDHKYLFLASGERQRFTPAQDPDQALGKILRFNLDGSVPADNPMASKGGARAITWSTGHRNPYGLVFAADGRLWENEMGPKGGDELNLIEPGKNYGWPNVSWGDNYDGTPIPKPKAGDGYQMPVLYWVPSISPSGSIIYSGSMFPQWSGNYFVGGMSAEVLERIELSGATAKKADEWKVDLRIRDIAQAPDGAIWMIQDGDNGQLMRLTPKN